MEICGLHKALYFTKFQLKTKADSLALNKVLVNVTFLFICVILISTYRQFLCLKKSVAFVSLNNCAEVIKPYKKKTA